MANWPITESYTNPVGEFVGYDTANSPLLLIASGLVNATVSGVNPSLLAGQEHIDIRGFVPSGLASVHLYNMLNLSHDTMNQLDALDMAQLSFTTSPFGDEWTVGNVGPIGSLKNQVGLTLTLASGNTTTTSTLAPVNLSTGFNPTDYICLSLPNFPAPIINKNASYVSLYDGINTQDLYLNQSATTITSGNTCAAWPYSSLTVTEPITVGLTFNALAPCTVEVTGLRLLSQEWQPLTLDMNTEGQFLRPILTQSGNFPPTTFPTAWRCAVPQGVEDPRPVNSSVGALFYTGSLTQSGTINLYQRGRSEAIITQLNLDYVNPSVGYTQGDLDALGNQPDFGLSYFQPSTQTVLNQETQSELNLQEQWQLERINDITDQYWIQSAITYRPNSGFGVGVTNYAASGNNIYYGTASGILAQNYYLFNSDVEGNTVRLTVDPVNHYGVVVGPRLFDSGIIQNSLIRRTAGRVGWGVQFGDGDAFIKTFLAQSLMFAEYKSKVFQSVTPVKGASLTVGATPSLQLFTSAGPYGGSSLSTSLAITNSPTGSTQIVTNAPVQGLISNTFTVTNISQFEIDFDIYIPAATLAQTTPICLLFNSVGYIFPLLIGQLQPNSWQSISIPSGSFAGILPGAYSFGIVSIIKNPVTWYMDNFSFSQRVIDFGLRSLPEDPWVGESSSPFVDLGDLLNDLSNGVTFEEFGSALQLRARAYAQNAQLQSFYITPSFAQLGNVTEFTQ